MDGVRIKDYIISNVTTDVPQECLSHFEEMRKCTSLEAAEKAAFFVARLKKGAWNLKNSKAATILNSIRDSTAIGELKASVVERPGGELVGVYDFYDVLGLLHEALEECVDADEYFEFASEFVVTADDVRRMLEIDRLKKELDEEYSTIKAHILQDAELFKDGSMFSTYELETADGIITVTDKQTLEVLRPGALVDVLKDERRDIVQESVGYKIGAAHSRLFVDIYKGNIGEATTEEFFRALYRDFGQYYYKQESTKDVQAFITQVQKQLKKDYNKNVAVFRKLFNGIAEDDYLKLAEDYYLACNRDEFLKLLVLAGVKPTDEKAVKSFISKVKATYGVTHSAAFTLRVKS